MTKILFQFCHDIICMDVSKTSSFYFQVYDHKEARSGKSCYVRVTARLLVDLVLFRDKVRAPSGMPWLFLTKAGAFIQPSVSKIIALIQSKTYGIMSN